MERPLPPPHLTEAHRLPPSFVPAPEVWDWIQSVILAETGPLYNPAHGHLLYAEIGVLWTNVECRKGMLAVVGKAEMAKERYQQQLGEWFPEREALDFLITLDAVYVATLEDAAFAALVEHELYHCAQMVSKRTGEPLWTEDDTPRFAIRGHDVEQFVGVVERYGPQSEAERQLVRAANAGPTIAPARIGLACGTCNRMVA